MTDEGLHVPWRYGTLPDDMTQTDPPSALRLRAAAVQAARQLARGEITREQAEAVLRPYQAAIAEAYRRRGKTPRVPSTAYLLRLLT